MDATHLRWFTYRTAERVIAALEAGEHEINTAPEGRREMQQLNITDPLAVDAALAPSLEALELAVRDHRSI